LLAVACRKTEGKKKVEIRATPAPTRSRLITFRIMLVMRISLFLPDKPAFSAGCDAIATYCI
jgi:hypothetical protein